MINLGKAKCPSLEDLSFLVSSKVQVSSELDNLTLHTPVMQSWQPQEPHQNINIKTILDSIADGVSIPLSSWVTETKAVTHSFVVHQMLKSSSNLCVVAFVSQ